MAKKTTGLDPASDRVVLVYSGDDAGNPHISGIPARDLSEADVVRLASIQDTDTDAVTADLVGSGIYTRAVEVSHG